MTDIAGPSGAGNDWPTQLVTHYANFQGASNYNVALTGETVTDMLAEYATQVQPHKPATAGAVSRVFFFAGHNDLWHSVPAATTYTNTKTYWAQARADGFVVIAFTVPPSSYLSSVQEAQRIIFNDDVRSDPRLYDYLIDVDANPAWVSADGHTAVAGVTNDGLHYTAATNIQLAYDINAALFSAQTTYFGRSLMVSADAADTKAKIGMANSGSAQLVSNLPTWTAQVPLSSGVITNVASITPPLGDWDVSVKIATSLDSATVVTWAWYWPSKTSAGISNPEAIANLSCPISTTYSTRSTPTSLRVHLDGVTPIYAVTQLLFSGGAARVSALIQATPAP